MMNFRKILALFLMVAVCAAAFDADARRRKRKSRKRHRTTKVVMKKPTATGPLQDMQPFVTINRSQPITKGLDNRIVALWQSHGKYYDQKQQRWQWQRPRLFGTVEDLFAQGYVIPYLIPMLENAGAYVMSPRERDLSDVEVIIDTDGMSSGDFYLVEGRHKWHEGRRGSGFAMPAGPLKSGENPFRFGTSEAVSAIGEDAGVSKQSKAAWNASLPSRGRYAVYVSYKSHENSVTDARYTVNHLAGSTHITVNQQMCGGTWVYLGHYDFAGGKQSRPIVELSNVSADANAVVSADAVKIGGGMGNIARAPEKSGTGFVPAPVTSGVPRFCEGARYWLQWAGMPESVYTESAGENDYSDDYKSRALWVNYLAGGSPMLPDSIGLNVPVDMALAFHTDAGVTTDGSVVGSFGFYSTDSGNLLGDGRSRLDCKNLANTIIDQIVADLRALHNPQWSLRGVRDRKLYEIRETKVPAMLIELLSHQNFEDMKYGLDPVFRFDVARAVYKGVLRFLARRYDVDCVVQPLPVGHFAIKAGGDGKYRLSWRQTIDSLEKTAYAKYYIVEERVGNGVFKPIATVTEPQFDVVVSDTDIHSYRIVAGNDGGCSFPSEVLALYDNGSGRPAVNIVNGFTRISAPDDFVAGEFGGFDFKGDAGVPDVCDIITTGEQYDFRMASAYNGNDVPGFGASRGNLENVVIAGNSRDFVYQHGCAVKSAGRGFVSSSVDAFVDDDGALSVGAPGNPPVIDLVLGKQKSIKPGNGSRGVLFKTFTPELQRRIAKHCCHGGSLLVSGSFVARDIFENKFDDDDSRERNIDFAKNILGYDYQPGSGYIDGKISTVSSPVQPFGDAVKMNITTMPSSDFYTVETVDALRPSGADAVTVMRYDENGLPAAVALDRVTESGNGIKSYRVVSLGFPFESIRENPSRNRIMKLLLDYLGPSR